MTGPGECGAADADASASREPRSFRDFGLDEDVLSALAAMGIERCTPIQEKVIEPILRGVDVVGKAETGTGKTIGFGAPMVCKMDTARVAVQGLVLTPTRELAQQVAEVLQKLGEPRGLRVALLVGGVHASAQIPGLRQGSQLAVGTPGRILDFLTQGILSLGWCEVVVLDEADRMLDMGFIDEVGAILDRIPSERQTLLFSATLPQGVSKLLSRYMRDPQYFSTSRGLATVPDIEQSYMTVAFPRKFHEFQRILDRHPDDTAIVFCNTRRQAIDLDRMLWGHGYSAGALHGDQEQDVRFRILESFRGGDIKVLVATDVASRGLDIEAVTRVINYEVPDEAEAYVHRIGRTGRANTRGIALTFVSPKERRSWHQIVRETGFTIQHIGHDGQPAPDEGPADDGGGAARSRRGRGRDRDGDQERRGGRGRGRERNREPEGERSSEPRGDRGGDVERGGGDRGGGDRGGDVDRGGGEVERSDRDTANRERGASGRGRRGRGGRREESADRDAAASTRAAERREAPRDPSDGSHPAAGGRDRDGDGRRSSRRRGRGRGGAAVKRPPHCAPDVETSPESSDAIAFWQAQSPARPRPPDRTERRAKLTLDDVDDAYLRAEYFDLDDAVLERVDAEVRAAVPHEAVTHEAVPGSESRRGEGDGPAREGGDRGEGRGRRSRSRSRGGASSRGGGGRRRDAGEGGRVESGGGEPRGRPASAASESRGGDAKDAASGGDPASDRGGGGGDGGRGRRRSRRRRRGSSGGDDRGASTVD